MTGMMFDFPTDADHIIYGGKFMVLDDEQDPLDESGTTYCIMQKRRRWHLERATQVLKANIYAQQECVPNAKWDTLLLCSAILTECLSRVVNTAIRMPTETEEREFGCLENIKDNYPKYVISMTPLVRRSDRQGITHLGLREFLQNGF